VFAREFRIVSLLRTGGMGAVYVAEQISTGKRRALKVMLPQLLTNAKQRARFEQEARVGGKIASEHVVSVDAAGIDEATDAPWLAMELLEGEELGTLVARRGAVPAEEAVEILEQIAHAVSAAHEAGIVHRDLKPENVFVARSQRARGAGAIVKVLDFGIAKLVADTTPRDTIPIGSPRWMAPEQTERAGEILPQTDAWAIGLLAFYLLTGRVFWLAAEDSAGGMGALIREMVDERIPTASERAKALGCGVELPAGFDAWFARSVHRDVGMRYRDARDQVRGLLAVFRPRGAARGARAGGFLGAFAVGGADARGRKEAAGARCAGGVGRSRCARGSGVPCR
jgi:serine/threonine-protein kinase